MKKMGLKCWGKGNLQRLISEGKVSEKDTKSCLMMSAVKLAKFVTKLLQNVMPNIAHLHSTGPFYNASFAFKSERGFTI